MSEISTEGINEELLRLGIDGMRSGRFKKGVGILHGMSGPEPGPDDTYCCLGALSIVAAENGCPVRRAINGVGHTRRETFGDQESEFLSAEVMRCFGFTTNNPLLLTVDGKVVTATHWNDTGVYGSTEDPRPESDFGPIADAFERTYLRKP